MSDTPTKKSLGQHWLKDAVSLEAMCTAAAVQPGDTVLEIGPGTGELTDKLLAHGAQVHALEVDAQLLPQLKSRFIHAGDQLTLIHGDIRTFDLTSLPAGYKLVANIPYYLTGYLLQLLSQAAHPPTLAALLVQKEVAQSVAAQPGSMSILAVTTQYFWQPSLGAEVPKQLFVPPPKIDSQILILKRRPQPRFAVDERAFFRLVKAGFSARRKKLRSSLAGGLRIEKTAVSAWLERAGLDPDARAQELSLDDWYALYQNGSIEL